VKGFHLGIVGHVPFRAAEGRRLLDVYGLVPHLIYCCPTVVVGFGERVVDGLVSGDKVSTAGHDLRATLTAFGGHAPVLLDGDGGVATT